MTDIKNNIRTPSQFVAEVEKIVKEKRNLCRNSNQPINSTQKHRIKLKLIKNF